MTSREFNTVLNLYTPNEKGLINNNNSSSSDNLTINIKASPTLFYSNHRKYYSIDRTAASRTMVKRTTVFHESKYNTILLVNKVI